MAPDTLDPPWPAHDSTVKTLDNNHRMLNSPSHSPHQFARQYDPSHDPSLPFASPIASSQHLPETQSPPLRRQYKNTRRRSSRGLRMLFTASVLAVSLALFTTRVAATPIDLDESILLPRQSNADSSDPTSYCTRWSQQTALVNGTIYLYGGRATQENGQTSNTYTGDFLTLDVTKTWKIGAPAFKAQPSPSGPPAVSNGYLWHSYDALYLYGGLFSDNPVVSPVPFALWQYDIDGSKWNEQSNPQTSSGVNSDGGNQPVQRAAEGAGISVPPLGRGYHFGGHLDDFTTPGWSTTIPRAYLKSLLEYTFPGYSNPSVDALKTQVAGSDGDWRNITSGGLQESRGFTERADGVLVWVPGFGRDGIILGLSGGTNATFTEMNVIDVYDVANSTWYKQATSGPSPPIRVDACAVAASAPDGSSTNIYLYGGQNLVPYGDQVQYSDVWILSVPSFTWIPVDLSGQSQPPPRAGHSCEIWDGQMIVLGGYVPKNITCDSPGIYVLDLSELKWQAQFTALNGGNAEAQQAAQVHNDAGLAGSYGYRVPAAVQSAIGGNSLGSATLTTPVAGATAGPLATGSPITYTVTGSDGTTVTQTGEAAASGAVATSSGPNVGAIVGGVLAGVFAALAAYLGFCVWIYRRQLQLYKNHVAASQRVAAGLPPLGDGQVTEKSVFLGGAGAGSSSDDRQSGDATSSSHFSGGRHATRSFATGGHAGMPFGTTSYAGPGGSHDASAVGADRNSLANSSTDDLLMAQEPTFVGVLLAPRRSLRVINRD